MHHAVSVPAKVRYKTRQLITARDTVTRCTSQHTGLLFTTFYQVYFLCSTILLPLVCIKPFLTFYSSIMALDFHSRRKCPLECTTVSGNVVMQQLAVIFAGFTQQSARYFGFLTAPPPSLPVFYIHGRIWDILSILLSQKWDLTPHHPCCTFRGVLFFNLGTKVMHSHSQSLRAL